MEIFKFTLTVDGKEIKYAFELNDDIIKNYIENPYRMDKYINSKEIDKARTQLTEMVKAIYANGFPSDQINRS